jgi:hypothetical protein
VAKQEAAYKAFLDKAQNSRLRHAADMLLGAFLLPKTEATESTIPTTASVYLELVSESHNAQHNTQREAATQACSEASVFHWPLAFPQVFAQGGFDCVLGNPPWEHVELKEEEFFATRNTYVAKARNKAERTQRIQWLSEGMLAKHLLPDLHHPDHECQAEVRLYNEYEKTKRLLDASSAFAHANDTEGGRYPLTGKGRVNTYALFSETIYQIISPKGRAGFIVPSGLATDNSTKDFFGELISKKALDSFFEFENEGFFSGAGQGHMLRFALTTIVGCAQEIYETRFLFQGKKIENLHDPERVFTLSPEDIFRVNPNTLTCPIFQSRYDAEITKKIYQQVPVLVSDSYGSQWGVRFSQGTHNMSTDSHIFKTLDELRSENFKVDGNTLVRGDIKFVPLYESKMVQLYNHRFGDFSDTDHQRSHVLPRIPAKRLERANYFPMPFYWVSESALRERKETLNWNYNWFIAWRRVTDARASSRTLIATVIPNCAAGDSLFFAYPKEFSDKRLYCAFIANMCAIPLDYVCRQKLGGLNLNFFTFKQLPFIEPEKYSAQNLEFIYKRVLQLIYTAEDLREWALDVGYEKEPFSFNLKKRAMLQSELDAYYARLYGLSREEIQFILEPELIKPGYPSETFAVLKRNEEREFGEYRTQRLVLEAWDKLEAGTLA